MITDKDVIQNLNFMCRTYDGINKLIVSTKNRLQSLNPEAIVKLNDIIQSMESQKGKVSRRIEKELDFWPIWSEWMKGVPGIGSAIGGNLIILYYYRFMPICKDCGTVLEKKDKTFWCSKCEKSVKGEGNLHHKIEIKDFPMISSWWHYLGMHNAEHCPVCRRALTRVKKNAEGQEWLCQITKGQNGKKQGCGRMFKQSEVIYLKPKRQTGVQSDLSTPGRQIGYQIGQSFQYKTANTGHLYRDYYDHRKRLRLKTHPDLTDGHRNNMALNETIKMFLSHFWQVARTLDGLSVTEPYIVAKDPVHKTIAPFYQQNILDEAA